MIATETIVIKPLATLIPAATFLNEQNCVSLQLNFTATGGSFLMTLLQGSVPLPAENTVLTMPFGRVGVVKNTGSGFSSGGLVDTISGSILPLSTTLTNFFGVEPGTAQFLSFIAQFLAAGPLVNWTTTNVPIKNFSFRGPALSGIQQLASVVLADVIVRKDAIYVVDPGVVVPGSTPFIVPKSDVVSGAQNIDYSLDVESVLNPALFAGQLDDEGDFVYDSDHCQKQPKTTVSTGTANNGFTPIPDGWLVDGTFEEWTPANPAQSVDNPSPSVARYWKQFPSPIGGGVMRGIITFNRLVKEIKIPGNVSTFVGSPITGLTNPSVNALLFQSPGVQGGIPGFNVPQTTLNDIITGQYLTLTNAIVLVPSGGGSSSGTADVNFYAVTLEQWLFPRVNPVVFPVGDPVNPFGVNRSVIIVNPNSNIANLGSGITSYWNKYISNYRRINSPRLKTNLTCVFRNNMPQVGDQLLLGSTAIVNGKTVNTPALKYYDCGRIQNVTLNFGRAGMTLSISAENYQFGPGLYQLGGGSEVVT